jgi:uncharacterized protein (AIM24 family)
MKHRLLVLTFGIVALLALPVIAFAQEAESRVIIAGTGSLTAEGDGAAKLRGSGTVEVTGQGKLIVIDYGNNAEVNIDGLGACIQKVITVERGSVTKWVCRGFEGSASVNGESIKVKLKGYDIVLNAEGTGVVALRGRGTYTAGELSGAWSDAGIKIEI